MTGQNNDWCIFIKRCLQGCLLKTLQVVAVFSLSLLFISLLSPTVEENHWRAGQRNLSRGAQDMSAFLANFFFKVNLYLISVWLTDPGPHNNIASSFSMLPTRSRGPFYELLLCLFPKPGGFIPEDFAYLDILFYDPTLRKVTIAFLKLQTEMR